MLSLRCFVTVAVAGAGIHQEMFQVVAGDRVHNAARGSSGVFMGTGLGAARCSQMWYLLYAPHEAA